MRYVLRALRLLAMVVWVGGLIFFAFVEAPTAFHIMGTTRQFALLIGGSIAGINHLGQIAGMVFVIASLLLWKHSSRITRKLLGAELLLVILMMAVTAYVQMHIVPAMERDRAAVGGDITSVPADNPTRAHFDALHARSEKVEGTGLFLGLGVVLLMAGEDNVPRPRPATR
jgi:uncharacterized membrane protein